MRSILTMLALLCFGLVASAQSKLELAVFELDTLTNAETAYYTLPVTLEKGDSYNYTIQVKVDSLSGATAGTLQLQQSNTLSGDFWEDVTGKAITINGVLTTGLIEGTTYALRLRLKATTSGTQSTEVEKVAMVVRRVDN